MMKSFEILVLAVCVMGVFADPREEFPSFKDLEYTLRHAKELSDGNFDALVQNGQQKNWFVMFHAPWCPHCKRLKPVFDDVAEKVKDFVNFGVVDCDQNPNLKDRFTIYSFPTLVYFSNGKLFEYPEIPRDSGNMTSFVMEGYLKLEGEEVPMEASRIKSFKKHLGMVVEKAGKLIMMYPGYSALFGVGVVAFIVISFLVTDYIFDKCEKKQEKELELKSN